MDDREVPELIVETSALSPSRSGVAHYTRELLKAYAARPGHFPIKLLSFRFFLKSKRAPLKADFAGLAKELGGEVEIRSRIFPDFIHNGLRRLGRRPSWPLDLRGGGRRRLYFFPDGAGAPLRDSPCVPVVFDLDFLRHTGTPAGRNRLYYGRYLPKTLNRADRVAVISEAMREELLSAFGVPPEKVTVVPPAVDHSVFRPDVPAETRSAVRAKYGLEGGFIYSLGVLESRKNFPRLIEAYASLPEEILVEYALVIGGPGGRAKEIAGTIRRRGLEDRVRLLGSVDEADRAPLCAEAAVFVMPSLDEGFGVRVLEAMACGTPVVTSSGGGLAEVGGNAVIYIDPLDPESIAGGICSVLSEPEIRDRLSMAGLAQAGRFRWEESARTLEDVFIRVFLGLEEQAPF